MGVVPVMVESWPEIDKARADVRETLLFMAAENGNVGLRWTRPDQVIAQHDLAVRNGNEEAFPLPHLSACSSTLNMVVNELRKRLANTGR